jgi:tetratricopeptide (TPR) repeat protein
LRRALEINEHSLGKDHPAVAKNLNSLAQLLQNTNRQAEAELLMRRALEINERSLGKDHPDVAIILHNLASFLRATNRFAEAEPIMRRAVEILLKFTRTTGHSHPHLQPVVDSYGELLKAMGRSPEELRKLAPELFNGQ